ncbi:MAG: recombination-associated protein RdgC [Lentisphaeria bacterium]|nr:MAG: recombination-associated protein RdgC [Lentisphaeria bacterium]
MPFEIGTFSVTLFALPQDLPENYIDLLNANRAGSLELVKDEPEIGWASGRCLLDSQIEQSTVLWNNLIYISLRKAERKIPSSMLKAWCQQEEQAWMRANGRTNVPSKQKKQIKEEVIEKNLMSIPPTLSSIPAVIDTANRMLYLGASSSAQIDLFVEYFVKTFHFEPIQINPEYYSESEFGKHADELPVIEFSTRADGETVPGRDFLTWLWYFSEQETGGYAGDSGSRRMYIHD